MNVTQDCASCHSKYTIDANTYNKMFAKRSKANCPHCGHWNVKTPNCSPGQQTTRPCQRVEINKLPPPPSVMTKKPKAKKKIPKPIESKPKPKPRPKPRVYPIRPAVNLGMGRTYNRSGIQPKTYTGPRTFEDLRHQVADLGRVFVMGTAPSLWDYDLELLHEQNWPTIGVNHVFETFANLDVLVLSDYGFICDYLPKIQEWQAINKGRYVFIMRETRRHGKRLQWQMDNRQHGQCVDKDTRDIIYNRIFPLQHSNVQYFDRQQSLIYDLEIPVRLAFEASVIFPAINLAFLLGAKEICLLGVEAEDNTHFFDHSDYSENIEFPKGEKIIDKLALWQKELKKQGCNLVTCRDVGVLPKKIPPVRYEKAACSDMPYHLQRLKLKVQAKKKCFLIGAGPSLENQPLQRLVGWPTITVNTAYQKYWFADALMFGDPGFVKNSLEYMQEWQATRHEKPLLFWHEVDRMDGFCRVISWKQDRSSIIHENQTATFTLTLALKRSIITPAINLAYWLGAKEIYLLGVDLDNCKHFWDKSGAVAESFGVNKDAFPGGVAIAKFIQTQYHYLLQHGVELATCYDGGLLKDKIPYRPLAEVADAAMLNPAIDKSFGGRQKKK